MQKFEVFEVGGELYLVVQAEHLLELNTVVLVPVIPIRALPALRQLTVDVTINGDQYRVRPHMPLTVESVRLRTMKPVARLSSDEGQKVLDGLNTIIWGL